MKICTICSQEFETDAWHPKALTCSIRCNELRMNEVRRKNRTWKGKLEPKACLECGETYTPNKYSWHKQKYCSERCGRRVQHRRFGYRDSRRLSSTTWRKVAKQVKERDGYKCRVCGKAKKRLQAHHLYHRTTEEQYDHDLDKLVTLCGSCHYRIHQISLGQENGELVLSGLIFEFLGIEEIKIAPRI